MVVVLVCRDAGWSSQAEKNLSFRRPVRRPVDWSWTAVSGSELVRMAAIRDRNSVSFDVSMGWFDAGLARSIIAKAIVDTHTKAGPDLKKQDIFKKTCRTRNCVFMEWSVTESQIVGGHL